VLLGFKVLDVKAVLNLPIARFVEATYRVQDVEIKLGFQDVSVIKENLIKIKYAHVVHAENVVDKKIITIKIKISIIYKNLTIKD
jgi:hypothetical protein